ncbi:PAS domain-containing protein [Paracoccus siganidrum]|nr:PAS domain-containing protein [Paracoccus siganidrum]
MSEDGGDDRCQALHHGAEEAQLLRMADYGRNQPARIVQDLRCYWQSLRRGHAVPARADVEPHGIGRALDHAFILERIAPGAARFRLAGRHLIDLMGMEVRGMPICAVLSPSSRGRFSDVLETVFRAPQLAEFRLLARADYARPELTGRMLIMPLRSDLGDVTRALGCLVSEGEPGAAPRRFDVEADEVLPLFEGGTVMTPSPSLSVPRLRQGFGERPARFERDPCREAAPGKPFTPVPTPADIPQTPAERRAAFRVITDNGAA